MFDVFNKITELKNENINFALCTIVSTKGSTPLKAGAKMIVCSDGRTFGTIGGGSLERQTIDKAFEQIAKNSNELLSVNLISDEAATCGGTADVFIEPLNNSLKLIIFGGGHISKAVTNIVKDCGFDITIIDDRKEIFDSWSTGNYKIIVSEFDEFISGIDFNDRLFIIIVSYDHRIDWDVLIACVSKQWHYLGMMGSRKKAATMKKKMVEAGISHEIIKKIDLPIGLDINAITAEEIAVSIASKLIMEKYKLLGKMKIENNIK
jgi:xanthine dehydrogenase accessory factor